MLRAFLTSLALLIPAASQGQMSADVQLAPGNFGTMVSGKIIGDEYMDYRLSASAGQKMFIELTVADSNGNEIIYFNLLPHGSDGVAIYNSSMDSNSKVVDLPETGTCTIRVYHMGNDWDAGTTNGFNLDLSIQ